MLLLLLMFKFKDLFSTLSKINDFFFLVIFRQAHKNVKNCSWKKNICIFSVHFYFLLTFLFKMMLWLWLLAAGEADGVAWNYGVAQTKLKIFLCAANESDINSSAKEVVKAKTKKKKKWTRCMPQLLQPVVKISVALEAVTNCGNKLNRKYKFYLPNIC